MKIHYETGRTKKRLSPLGAKRSTSKHTCAAITTIVLGLAVTTGYAFAQTQYERQNQGPRLAPWEQPDTNVRRQSTGSPSIENSNLPIDAEALTSSYERIRQNPGWVAVEDQVGDQTDRIGDLEDLLDQMDESLWQEDPTPSSVSGFQPTGNGYNYGAWVPAISAQTADFRQDRTYSQDFVKVMEVYETHKLTNETRLARSYDVNETRTLTESRIINVASRSDGTGDGWSAWINIGDFKEQRSIYYFVANTGALVDSKNESRDMPRSENFSVVVSNDPLSYNNPGINTCQTKVAQHVTVNASQVTDVSVEALKYRVDGWQCGPKGTITSECAVVKGSNWNNAYYGGVYDFATSTSYRSWLGSATRLRPGTTTTTEGYMFGDMYGNGVEWFSRVVYNSNRDFWAAALYFFDDPNSAGHATITSYRCRGTVNY